MSKKVQVYLKDKGLHGQRVILPEIGEIEIEKDGIIEVSKELAGLLVNDDSPWDLVLSAEDKAAAKKAKKEVVKEQEIEEEEEDEEDEEEEEDEETDETQTKNLAVVEEVKGKLNKLTVEKLVKMAETAEYPAKEYKAFKANKKLMVDYLVKKTVAEAK